MTRKFSSISVQTTLATGISNTALTVPVAVGTGSTLMGGVSLAGGNVDQYSIIIDPDTASAEIMWVTGVSSDNLTVLRGQDGTSAVSHNAGAVIKHVLTGGDLTYLIAAVAPTANLTVGLPFPGSTSGTTTVKATAIAGTNTLTLPATNSDTLVGKATTDVLTNKDLSSSTNTFPANYAAGKNLLINGDFAIWQRGLSASINSFGADRWLSGGGYGTQSAQALAPGTIAGINSPYYCQVVTAANSGVSDYGILEQRIENVATAAGQQVVLTFWAKAASGTPKVAIEINQNFGSGGSAVVYTTVQSITLSTVWTRYSVTFTVPSISGKTVGAGSFLAITTWLTAGSNFASRASNIGNQAATFGFSGYQLEIGGVATAFQLNAASPNLEYTQCQSRYYRNGGEAAYQAFGYGGQAFSTTQIFMQIQHPVEMRSVPTLIDYSNLVVSDGVTNIPVTTIAATHTRGMSTLTITVASGLTQYRNYSLNANNSLASYFGIGCEL